MSDEATFESAELRIGRRLRIQHARWLSQQPVRNSRWFQFNRRLGRSLRRFAITINRWWDPVSIYGNLLLAAVCVLLVIVVAVGAIYLVTVGPSKLLLVKPDRVTFASESQQISVALTRWAIMSTMAMFFLWSMVPSAARTNPLVTSQGNPASRKRQRLIRTGRTLQPLIGVKSLKYVVLVGVVLGSVSLLGIVAAMPHPAIALLMGGLSCLAIGWFVWSVGVRLRRRRGKLFGRYTIAEYLRIPLGIGGLMSCLLLFAPATVRLSDWLPLLGPLGWQAAELQSLGDGNWGRLFPLGGFMTVAIAAGWYCVKDAGTWANRRKLVENLRYLTTTTANVPTTNNVDSPCDLIRHLRRDLNQSLRARRIRSWRYWLLPLWLRKYAGGYLMLSVTMIVFQLVVWPLQLIVSNADPITVVGGATPKSPISLLTIMALPIVIMFVVLEVLAIFDDTISPARTVAQRPISAIRFWLNAQRDGLMKLPLQILLLLPIALFPLAAGSIKNIRAEFVVSALGLVLLYRTVSTTWILSMSLFPVMQLWSRTAVKAALFVGFYSACFGPIVLVQAIAKEQIDFSYVLISVFVFNLVWCCIYGFVGRYRRGVKV